MELEFAAIFILFIILILWEIKADFLLLILGIAAYIFLVFFIVTSDPLNTIPSILDFLLLNPLGLISFSLMLGLFSMYKFLKKKYNKLKN